MKQQTWHDPGRAGRQPGWGMVRSYAQYAPVVIETGSGAGAGTKDFAPYYQHVYSIEYSPVMFESAKYNLSKVPNVTLINDNSEDILFELLEWLRPKWGDNYVLFLDAHISDINLALEGQSTTAIWKEMFQWEMAVKEQFKLYTLIDDARLFDGTAYPSQDWIKEFAQNNAYSYELINDVMVLAP